MQSSSFASDTVCWELWSRDPAPALRPHVLGYVGYREWGSAGFRRLEPPSGEVHVILSFGPQIVADGRPLGSFVAAPHTRHAVVESAGAQHCVELRLTPLGAHMALGLPMDELAGSTLALEDLWPGADELIERLLEAPSWAARFGLLDAVLGERLAAARPPAAEIERAWWRLVRSHGSVAIADLVRDSGWSRRHFSARFSAHAGLPPKAFARVLRFARATEMLGRPGHSLCEIALACGYYDQAHLNRDFREFAGCTPVELAAKRLPAGYAA